MHVAPKAKAADHAKEFLRNSGAAVPKAHQPSAAERLENFRSFSPSASFVPPNKFIIRKQARIMAEEVEEGRREAPRPRLPPAMLNADEGRLFPPLEYMQLSDPVRFFEDPTGRVAPGGPKLIVLDLNGALLFRSATRKAHPRPYLRAFLQYIFHPGHQSASGESERPYEVFVWSSAQPHNVQYMVDYAFGPYAEGLYDPQTGEPLDADIAERSGKLLGVWARDKLLNASTSDYRASCLLAGASFH